MNTGSPEMFMVYDAATTFQPTSSRTWTFYWPYATNYKSSNLFAATSWAIRHNTFTPGSETEIRVAQAYCGAINDQYSCPTGIMAKIKYDDRDYKFRIDEIFGQAWFDAVLNGSSDPNLNYSFSNSNCLQYDSSNTAWDLTGDKYNSIAAYYGFGLYYAAAAFNDETETNCDYYYDFNWDWTNDLTWEGPGTFPCISNVYHSWCEYYQCNNTPYYGNGVALDWLRFNWDMARSDHGGYSFATIADVYSNSTPTSWSNAQSNVFYQHLLTTASTQGGQSLRDDWDSYSTSNGVAH